MSGDNQNDVIHFKFTTVDMQNITIQNASSIALIAEANLNINFMEIKSNNYGIYYSQSNPQGYSLYIQNSNVSQNSTGIQTPYYGSFIIENSTITDNTTGIWHGPSKDAHEIKNSLIKNNNIGISGGYLSKFLITNSILRDNDTAIIGGRSGRAWIVNSLIIDNGAGIYVQDDYSMAYNTIFKNNSSFAVDGSSNTYSITLENNYIDIDNVYIQDFSVDNIFEGVILGFKNADKKDYHIESTSDLIDMGTSIDPYPFIPIPVTDLDGNPRPVGSSTDIGPYEYQ